MMEKSQYKSFKEWREANPAAYQAACRQKLINEICERFGWIKKKKWTKKECIEESKNYATLNEFRSGNSGAYGAAKRFKIEKLLCKLNNWEKKKHTPANFWTKEKCIREAKRYKTKKEWQINSNGSMKAARRNNWLKDCIKHMIKKRKENIKWTKEKCIEEAKKYKTRGDWQKQSSSSYKFACDNNLLTICSKHMVNPRMKWTKEKCIEEAKKYDSLWDWGKNNKSAYNSAQKNGWLNEICSHMIKKK